MHSSILGKTLQFRVAASTIRTVEKKGGLDEFLLNSSNSHLTEKAQKLKLQLVQAKIK